MSDLKGISKTLWPPLTSRQWDKLPEPTKKSFNTRWEGIVKAITKLETERDALAAEVERLGKEVERWNALEAERAEFLRRTIGSAGLEHFVREWKDLKDERDRYKTALDRLSKRENYEIITNKGFVLDKTDKDIYYTETGYQGDFHHPADIALHALKGGDK